MPIAIQRDQPTQKEEIEDPASLLERTMLDTVNEDAHANSLGHSATPKPQGDKFLVVNNAHTDDETDNSAWVTMFNPCNPRKGNMRVASRFRKWQHVFPVAISSGAFKWSSMCSPAALPLTTEHRPLSSELEKHCEKRMRRLLLPSAVKDEEKAPHILNQLIALRLLHGFQLPSDRLIPASAMHIDVDTPVLMSLGGLHHELRCLSSSEIQIVEYTPHAWSDGQYKTDAELAVKYSASIQPAATRKIVTTTIHFAPEHIELDWSGLDEQVVKHDGSSVDEGGSKMRLVLIPVELVRTGQASSRELSDDEMRLEGIQRLTQLWQRNRYFTEEDQRHHASVLRTKTAASGVERDPNPLAIEFQTGDPSAIVNAYGPTLTGQLGNEAAPPLFSESEMYHSSTFDIARLVKQMQEKPPNGVEVRDRRWFTRLHLKCFRGDEMVNWLLRVFKDLHTREDAIDIGNELMKRGIFSHVRHKHDFRDGNYFYQITSSHRTVDYPDTASMFGKGLRSVPSTPMADSRNSPMLRPAREESSSSSGKETPTLTPADRKQLLLSQCMQCNVDPAAKSDQPEVVNLHYGMVSVERETKRCLLTSHQTVSTAQRIAITYNSIGQTRRRSSSERRWFGGQH